MEGEGEVSRHKAVMELSGGSPPSGEIRAGSARKTELQSYFEGMSWE